MKGLQCQQCNSGLNTKKEKGKTTKISIKKAPTPERHIVVNSNEFDIFPDVIKSMIARRISFYLATTV